eukprot:TRINITY_DN3974_c0_g1_i1.p1 TRINITY_DN3974_c0_g1~~TRINITY_DN3974_c0_g1_i1.p1  ORF type:complete len:849 (+),score=218.41 TRINITY_DN3974_c0_g1_i1:250-2796(+)
MSVDSSSAERSYSGSEIIKSPNHNEVGDVKGKGKVRGLETSDSDSDAGESLWPTRDRANSLDNENSFQSYIKKIAQSLFSEEDGIRLHKKIYHLHRWLDTFKGIDAKEWLVSHKTLDESEANSIMTLLLQAGYICSLENPDERERFDEKETYFKTKSEAELRRLKSKKKKNGKYEDLEEDPLDLGSHQGELGTKMVRNALKDEKMKTKLKHKSAKSVTATRVGAGATTGGITGAVVGGVAGLLGGPFFIVTVPAGAVIGGTIGAGVGAGVGGGASAYFIHRQSIREENTLRQFDDVATSSIPLAEMNKYMQELKDQTLQAQMQGKATSGNSSGDFDLQNPGDKTSHINTTNTTNTVSPSGSKINKNQAFLFPPVPQYKQQKPAKSQDNNLRKSKHSIVENQGIALFKGTKDRKIDSKAVKHCLFNFRDLADAVEREGATTQGVVLNKRLIYRSACISRGGADLNQAANLILYWRNVVGIKTIIDFRNPDEKERDPNDGLLEKFYPTIRYAHVYEDVIQSGNEKVEEVAEQGIAKAGINIHGEDLPTPYADTKNDGFRARRRKKKELKKKTSAVGDQLKEMDAMYTNTRKRFAIPLMTVAVKLNGMFWEGSDRATKISMMTAVFGGEVGAKTKFIEGAMNPMGLAGLNRIMLIHAGEQIVKVLRVCSDRRNYPIVYHCSSGKDRTGLITAMILAVSGVDRDDIIENYRLSEVFLAPVLHLIREEDASQGLAPEFSTTPAIVMQKTLDFITEVWGSVANYLAGVGFTHEEQDKLRRVMTTEEGKDIAKDNGIRDLEMEEQKEERGKRKQWKRWRKEKKKLAKVTDIQRAGEDGESVNSSTYEESVSSSTL